MATIFPRRRRVDLEFVQNTLLLALAVVSTPFVPTDWPLSSHRRPVPQFDAPPNLLGTTLAPAEATVPFVPADWPPIRQTHAVQSDVPPNLLSTTLAPVVSFVPHLNLAELGVPLPDPTLGKFWGHG